MGIDFTVFKGCPDDGIVEATSHRELPTVNQVLVKITHSGIRGTDEHYKQADMVLDHEGVGTVEQLGERVKGLVVGDVVGWGYIQKMCGACVLCLSGELLRANSDRGGRNISWILNHISGGSGSFCTSGLAPDAAPLMCGAAAVFGVIETYNIRPTDRVGFVSVGGLGHLAIQFLVKMGVRTVVFSSTEAKRAEALELGTAEFYTTAGAVALDIGAPTGRCGIVNVMQSMGRIYALTIGEATLSVPAMPVVIRGLTVQGSGVRSRCCLRRRTRSSPLLSALR
ncbi:putative NADP-dependent alcohol dehydrogenase C 2 [Mycena vulgaris]|nr:putative NADP-dependent alcohol dehydrogenase C 2 [Mycena vulgaris]